MKETKQKHILLKGNGGNQHTLKGEIAVETEQSEFVSISVLKEADLRHEQPSGSFGEHNTLKVEQGEWVTGKQVEFNPFKGTISQVWD
jgi:hypothetical protein